MTPTRRRRLRTGGRTHGRTRSSLLGPALAVLLLATLSACSEAPLEPLSQSQSEAQATPELGTCHRLTPDDVAAPSPPPDSLVECAEPHTAQTYAVGTLPDELGSDYDDPALGRWMFPRCERAFQRFIGADESLAMRVQLSWAWFRPSEEAWADGARWYRCDLVGGPADATDYRELPETAEGLFSQRPPEEWLTCARGEEVASADRVPCSEEHDWRAVTTIRVGRDDDEYPGDRTVQVTSRDFCSDSVAAWKNYPVEYEFGFTWFREAEWQAGNRRSICWARITES